MEFQICDILVAQDVACYVSDNSYVYDIVIASLFIYIGYLHTKLGGNGAMAAGGIDAPVCCGC